MEKNVKWRILDKWTGIHCLSCQQTLAELASVRISNTGTTKVSKCEKGRGAEGDRADIDSLLHMGGETKQRWLCWFNFVYLPESIQRNERPNDDEYD
jgi:hypothetical protein